MGIRDEVMDDMWYPTNPTKEPKPGRVIQISAAGKSDLYSLLFALCQDGSIWSYCAGEWRKMSLPGERT